MGLSPELKALDGYYARQNRARVERLHEPITGPWRVTWRFAGCRHGDTFTDKFESPQELVRGMAKRFNGGENYVIARVFEMVA